MPSKGYLFDRRTGQIVDEVPGMFQRAWKRNAINTASYDIPAKHAKNIEANFNFGNFCVILNDEGLIPWAGRFEPELACGDQLFEHTLFSTEYVWSTRMGPWVLPYGIIKPAGTIYKRLIDLANGEEDTLVRPGAISEGGKNCATIISPTVSLSENLASVVKQSGHEYDITPSIDNNRLSLLANWYEINVGTVLDRLLGNWENSAIGPVIDRGFTPRNCEMRAGSFKLVGPIYNVIVGLGKENSQGGRKMHVAIDWDSVAKFGRRETKYSVNSEEQEAVDMLTESELKRMAWPRQQFKARVNNSDDLYPLLRNGNIQPYETPYGGYARNGGTGTQAWVKTLGMAYTDGDDGVELSLQKVTL